MEREATIFDMRELGRTDGQLLFDKLFVPQISRFGLSIPNDIQVAAAETANQEIMNACLRFRGMGTAPRLVKVYLKAAHKALNEKIQRAVREGREQCKDGEI